MDLRQNQRGRFMKVTMLAGKKTFVAIPGESIAKFRDNFAGLLDAHASEGEDPGEGESSREPRSRGRPRSPPRVSSEAVADSREVRAGGKRFYFDVDQNDRGTFIKLSEV